MTEEINKYRQVNQEIYDDYAIEFVRACACRGHQSVLKRKELTERMKLLDFRLKELGEE